MKINLVKSISQPVAELILSCLCLSWLFYCITAWSWRNNTGSLCRRLRRSWMCKRERRTDQ